MKSLTFDELRDANKTRMKEWTGSKNIDIEFRTIELCGEVGELANVVKKYLRVQRGIKGSTATTEEIADELGDVIISANLLADFFGINLGEATRAKFNKTSNKYELETKL